MIRHDLRLDLVGILLEHEEGGYRYVGAAPVVCHYRLPLLAALARVRRAGFGCRAEAGVVGDDHSRGADALGVPDLLDEGASAPIDHEDVGGRPRHHGPGVVHGADGVSAVRVDGIEVARVVLGVVHRLGERAAVGGDAEEGLAVIVPSRLGQGLGNLM